MSEPKTNKTEVSTKRSAITIAGTVATVIVGIIAMAVILGLAAKGLASYLQDMNDITRTAASIVGTALLAYAVAGLARVFAKYVAK